MPSKDLKVNLIGDTKGLDKAFSGIGRSLGKIGKIGGAALLGVGAGFAAAGAGAFKLGQSFDEAFDTIRVGTGATGDTLDGLKDSFKNVLRDVPTDFASAGTAIADLNTRLGLEGDQLETLSKQTLELSRITGTDLGTNIDTVTRAFGDWGVETDDMSSTLDDLFVASQATGVGVDEIAQKVVQFGAPLRNLGFTLEESVALFGKWGKEGVNTEAVMAGLKIGIGKLAKEGKDVPKAFDEIIASIENAGSTSEATAIAIEAFGQRAGPDLADAVLGGKFELDELIATIANSEETILGAAEDTKSFGEQWTIFKNTLATAVEPIATRVFEGIGSLMEKLGPKIEVVVDWLDEHLPAAFAFVEEKWAEIQPVLIDGFNAVKGWVEENWPTIREIIVTAMETIQSAIETIVAAIRLLWRQFLSKLVAWAREHWDEIRTIIESSLGTIQGTLETATAAMEGDWDRSGNELEGLARKYWEGIKAIVGLGLEKVRNDMRNTMEAARAAWAAAWAGVQQLTHAAWAAIGQAVTAGVNLVLTFMRNLPAQIASALASLPQLLYDKGWAAMTGLWDGLSAVWGNIASWISGLPGAISGAFGSINLFSIGSAIMGSLWSGLKSWAGAIKGVVTDIVNTIRSVPKNILGIGSPSKVFIAYGENVMQGMALGLEKGFGSMVQPALDASLDTMTPGAGGPGAPVSINVYNSGSDLNPDAVVRALRIAQRRRGTLPISVR